MSWLQRPNTPVDEFVDFEDGRLPPAGWAKVTSADGGGTEVSIEAAAAHSGASQRKKPSSNTNRTDLHRCGDRSLAIRNHRAHGILRASLCRPIRAEQCPRRLR